jgi:hypothetical protein
LETARAASPPLGLRRFSARLLGLFLIPLFVVLALQLIAMASARSGRPVQAGG